MTLDDLHHTGSPVRSTEIRRGIEEKKESLPVSLCDSHFGKIASMAVHLSSAVSESWSGACGCKLPTPAGNSGGGGGVTGVSPRPTLLLNWQQQAVKKLRILG